MKYFRRGSALSGHMIKSLHNDNNGRRLQFPLTACNAFSANVLRPGEYKSNPLNTHLASSGIISSNASRYATSAQEKPQGEEEATPIDQRKLPADYNPSTFDPAEHRSPPTERVFRLVDEIAGLTLLEVADLTDVLKKKFNIKDMPIMTMMMPGMGMPGMPGPGAKAGASKGEDKKPVKTSFDLKLESFDAASKIKIIKEVRTFTDLGLKEAKDLVEKTPALLKKGVTKEEGEQIIEKLNALGAKVVME